MSKIWPGRYMSHAEEYGLPRVRALVGTGPTDKELILLLDTTGGCVSTVAEKYWGNPVDDGSDDGGGENGIYGGGENGVSDSESSASFDNLLQARFDFAFCGRPMRVSDLNALAIELADAGETAALIAIWDELKGIYADKLGSLSMRRLLQTKVPSSLSRAQQLHQRLRLGRGWMN